MRRHIICINGFQILMLIVLASSVSAAPEPKGTIKTIKAKGALIDCIDIYKQHALDHPLLQNHTIQLKPSWYLEEVLLSDEGKNSLEPQDWTKYGQCPNGSIPVLRNSPTLDIPFPGNDFLQDIILGHNRSSRINDQSDSGSTKHELAMAFMDTGDFYGERALLNLWNPKVTADKEMSISSGRLVSFASGDNFDRIEAGWMVTSTGPYANKPVFYVYWTAYGSNQTNGCFNLDCPGFVKVEKNYALGCEIRPFSQYDGKQYELEVTIVKDQFTGHWWVQTPGINWGYWPNELFTNLNTKANFVFWGGEVVSSSPLGSHTGTQMGSGYFPDQGFKHACYTRNLSYYTEDQALVRLESPDKLHPFVTHPNCYAVDIVKNIKTNLGLHFFFGGPGFSDICRD